MKSYLSLLTLLSISIYSIGQTTYTPIYTWSTFGIKTPKGANIESGRLENVYYLGNTYSDYPNEVKIAYRDLFENNPANSNKKVEGDITFTYNCHSYAWNKAEGGTINHWITAYYNSQSSGNDNLSQYWGTNGGYTEVSSRNDANKIYYSDGDHSALLTSTSSDTVISKWGAMLLVKHHYLDCPYTLTNLKYYNLSNPTISGSTSLLCNNVQRTFSGSGFTDIDLDYDWSAPSPLSEVSEDGTSSYTVKGTSQNGLGTVSLMVTTPSGATATASKNVWVGAPVISSIDGPQGAPNNYWAYYSAELESSLSAPTDYNWTLSPLNGNYVYEHGEYFDILFSNTGNYQLVVHAQNTCSAPNFGPYYVRGIYVYTSYYMSISPNPTTGETTLSIESNTEEPGLKSASTEPVFDETAEWELEIYSPNQILKEKKTKLKGKSTTIQTQSWKEGVYVVRVKYKGEILIGKLVVKK